MLPATTAASNFVTSRHHVTSRVISWHLRRAQLSCCYLMLWFWFWSVCWSSTVDFLSRIFWPRYSFRALPSAVSVALGFGWRSVWVFGFSQQPGSSMQFSQSERRKRWWSDVWNWVSIDYLTKTVEFGSFSFTHDIINAYTWIRTVLYAKARSTIAVYWTVRHYLQNVEFCGSLPPLFLIARYHLI